MVRGIIFITIDSLRVDHLNVYGYSTRRTTPNIDLLARDSLVFLNHVSVAPYTSLSMNALFTSSYPFCKSRHNEPCPIPKNKRTLPQELLKRGFTTIALQDSNPFLSSMYGYDRGFSLFIDYLNSNSKQGKHHVTEKVIDKIIKNSRLNNFVKYYVFGVPKPIYGVSNVVKEMISIIRRMVDQNKIFFIWSHLMDVHGPHNIANVSSRLKWVVKRVLCRSKNLCSCPSKVIEALISLYDSEIRYVDEKLGRLFDWLKDNGLYNDVMIILTADHGEEFCDHQGYGHTARLYDELIRVPLIIKLPNHRAEKITHLTSHVITSKIILSMLDNIEGSLENDRSVRDIIEKVTGALSIAYDSLFDIISYRNDYWKLITYFNNRSLRPYKLELYNIRRDPREKYNIVDSVDKEVVEELMKPILTLRRILLMRNIIKSKRMSRQIS